MNENFLEEFKELQTVALNLMKCSNDKCSQTQKEIMKDKTLFKDLLGVLSQKDIKKKAQLMTKLYKNKVIHENSKCIFNNCKEVYKELLNVLITKFDKLIISKELKKNAIKLLNKNKKIIEKINITDSDIMEIVKNFNLIQGFIKIN
jgi:hypothetical protein